MLYNEEHIEGAVNYMYTNQDYKNINIKQIQDNDNIKVIVYCDSKICSLAKYLALAIKKRYKLSEVYYLKGGIEEWKKVS